MRCTISLMNLIAHCKMWAAGLRASYPLSDEAALQPGSDYGIRSVPAVMIDGTRQSETWKPASKVSMLMTTLLPIPCPQCQSRRGVAQFDDDGETYTLKCGTCNHDVHLGESTLPDEAAA